MAIAFPHSPGLVAEIVADSFSPSSFAVSASFGATLITNARVPPFAKY